MPKLVVVALQRNLPIFRICFEIVRLIFSIVCVIIKQPVLELTFKQHICLEFNSE